MGVRYVTIDEESGEEVWEDECLMGYKGATNNQMELLACTLGLKGVSPRFNMADSTLKCNGDLEEYFMGSFHVQGFAGSVIELVHHVL